MKILKQGLSKEEIERMEKSIRTFYCAKCWCAFEAESGEYKTRQCDYNDIEYVCECPNCGFTAREWDV